MKLIDIEIAGLFRVCNNFEEGIAAISTEVAIKSIFQRFTLKMKCDLFIF
jgi:hypothetical protein